MVDRVLSQDEIDALFQAMQTKEEARASGAAKAQRKKKVSPFDFRQSDRISKEQIRSLHMIHDYFARNFSSSLSAYLRSFVEINLVSVEQMSYAEFLQFIPEITSYNSISLKPLEGNIVLEINPNLIFPMIDILLGGPGLPPSVKREITEIETSLISGIINLGLRDLKEAWKPIMDIDFQVEVYESKPHLLQVISISETVVAIGFEMKFGDNRGMMNLGIPTILLKMIRHNFDQQWGFRRKDRHYQSQEKIRRILLKVPLELSGEVRGGQLSVRDFLELEEGDVFVFPHQTKNPVFLSVEAIPTYLANLIKIGNMKGLSILRPISDEDLEPENEEDQSAAKES